MADNCECLKDALQFDRDNEREPCTALREGHIECVKALVTAGFDVTLMLFGLLEVQEEYNLSEKHLECAKYLIGAGATVLLDKENFESLSMFLRCEELSAAAFEMFEMVLELVSNSKDLEQLDEDGNTLLSRAVCLQHVGAVRRLIEAGVDVNQSPIPSDSIFARGLPIDPPLLEAAGCGLEQILKMLIEAGADVNQTHLGRHWPNCSTALVSAARSGQLGCLKILLEAGASLEDCGSEALLHTIDSHKDEALKEVMRLGVNVTGSLGGKALGKAVEKECFKLVRILLEAGADPQECDVTREYNLSKDSSESDIVDAIVKSNHEGNKQSALENAASNGCARDVQRLIEYGADVNFVSPLWKSSALEDESILKFESFCRCCWETLKWTPLQRAVTGNTREVIRALLEAQADVNIVDNRGNTALMSLYQSLWTCSALLRAGAKINIKNLHGNNAVGELLGGLSYSWNPGFESYFMLLVSAGENIAGAEGRLKQMQSFLNRLKEDETGLQSLKRLCRTRIRELLSYPGAVNLFVTVPQLGLPGALVDYMLYGRSLVPLDQ